jgi:hypothetical protein
MIKALNKIKKYLQHKKVLRELIGRYELQYETELILEQWIIHCITERKQLERREELNKKQGTINEIRSFITYLKLQK